MQLADMRPLLCKALIYSVLEIMGAAMAAGVFKVTHEAEGRESKVEASKAEQFAVKHTVQVEVAVQEEKKVDA